MPPPMTESDSKTSVYSLQDFGYLSSNLFKKDFILKDLKSRKVIDPKLSEELNKLNIIKDIYPKIFPYQIVESSSILVVCRLPLSGGEVYYDLAQFEFEKRMILSEYYEPDLITFMLAVSKNDQKRLPIPFSPPLRRLPLVSEGESACVTAFMDSDSEGEEIRLIS